MSDEEIGWGVHQSDVAGVALMTLAGALWWYDPANQWSGLALLVIGASLLVKGRLPSMRGGPSGIKLEGEDSGNDDQ